MNNRKRYPKDWKRLSTDCKERAGWRCEKCFVPHRFERVSYSGRLYPVYLVAAHKFHDPENPNPVLVCLCPSCHWRHFRAISHPPVWLIEKLKHRKLLQAKGVL